MSDKLSFTDLFPKTDDTTLKYAQPVAILDGGMGTTLQTPPFSLPLDSSLWSSELLATDQGRAQLSQLHELWIHSGADAIGSCTYQSCLPLFVTHGPSQSEDSEGNEVQLALQKMNAAIPIITKFSSSNFPPENRPIRSVLALGPFGAICSPGQEYAGQYPAPYGKGTVAKASFTAEALNRTLSHLPSAHAVPASADPTEDSLVLFHLDRLVHLSESPEFNSLDIYAFETIPIVREARAIRRAVSLFESLNPSRPRKPFYLSFVFPVSPEGDFKGKARLQDPDLQHLGQQDLVAAILEATFSPSLAGARPDGIGINCTNPLHIQEVVESLATQLSQGTLATPAPWFILYPDGGAVYDVVTKTWSNPEGLDDDEWAHLVANGVEQCLESTLPGGVVPTFAGVLAGGCCKAGPSAIKALRRTCVDRKLLL
ncbi:Homocysteine S-methyltransferase [Meredithblackwellia eburnea MCA 4105]